MCGSLPPRHPLPQAPKTRSYQRVLKQPSEELHTEKLWLTPLYDLCEQGHSWLLQALTCVYQVLYSLIVVFIHAIEALVAWSGISRPGKKFIQLAVAFSARLGITRTPVLFISLTGQCVWRRRGQVQKKRHHYQQVWNYTSSVDYTPFIWERNRSESSDVYSFFL